MSFTEVFSNFFLNATTAETIAGALFIAGCTGAFTYISKRSSHKAEILENEKAAFETKMKETYLKFSESYHNYINLDIHNSKLDGEKTNVKNSIISLRNILALNHKHLKKHSSDDLIKLIDTFSYSLESYHTNCSAYAKIEDEYKNCVKCKIKVEYNIDPDVIEDIIFDIVDGKYHEIPEYDELTTEALTIGGVDWFPSDIESRPYCDELDYYQDVCNNKMSSFKSTTLSYLRSEESLADAFNKLSKAIQNCL
ncbi:hypothetical protein [Oribacterium sp. WCC10]|uniref:hypothetical protein n=1 Tax=Oribacterium sp. WCC10 TaxID=1855343 RepID=UPI0008F38CAE|nr:hypothetical protein [Oribacterium sp. WCC10]SFG18759.1 hypothetical protein SAMN05216356_10325 [Oribacterium sp. WCC10]